MTFVLRTAGTPATLSATIREAIWRVDRDQPVGAVRTMDETLASSLSRRRFSVTLLAAFGVIAVTLAAVGLYGVRAFIVAQRKREIGVHMALGASPRAVIADVLGHGLKLAGFGIVAGIGLALPVTRLLSSLLLWDKRDGRRDIRVRDAAPDRHRGGRQPGAGVPREPRRSVDCAAGRLTTAINAEILRVQRGNER